MLSTQVDKTLKECLQSNHSMFSIFLHEKLSNSLTDTSINVMDPSKNNSLYLFSSLHYVFYKIFLSS